MSASAKLVTNIGGETPPAPRAERNANFSAQPQNSRAILYRVLSLAHGNSALLNQMQG